MAKFAKPEELGKELRKQFIRAGIYGQKIAVCLGKLEFDSAITEGYLMNERFFDY
jgi:hypothetical protein